MALADTELVSKQCCHQEILRCIHVGLLCVQEQANNRPSMSMVISMLNSEIIDLLSPTQPAFTAAFYGESLPNNKWSINDVTITNTEGRWWKKKQIGSDRARWILLFQCGILTSFFFLSQYLYSLIGSIIEPYPTIKIEGITIRFLVVPEQQSSL